MKMNLDELTIGEAKELASLFGGKSVKKSILESAIGKYVIIRSRNEGINFGKVMAADETGCVIEEARRIWHHKPLDSKTAWYEGVAKTGVHKDSKISCETTKYIIESYSIIYCTDEAINSIKKHKSHES